MNSPKATLDFETRSACNLKKHGPWRYSIDPSTQILCFVYRLPHWPAGQTALWTPDHEEPDTLQEMLICIQQNKLIEAHNVWFEFCIWRNILEKQYGFPEIPLTSWRCSAAKASTHALPRSLDDALKALKLPISKDADGHKLMLKMSKPRRSRKAEREAQAVAKQVYGTLPPKYLWHETPEQLERLIAYCRQDVLAEEALSHALPDIAGQELELFQLDLTMNLRGFQIDRDAVKVAQQLIHREGVLLNHELAVLTNYQVKRATQRDRMIAWFQEQGLEIYDTKKETIETLLKAAEGFDYHVTSRALEIIRSLGRSSTAKYRAMSNWMGADGRVRGGLLYHGATTGRWAGKGVQPHNFPKGTLQKVDVEELWTTLKNRRRDEIVHKFSDVMEALSTGLRSAIIAAPDHQLYVADYAAIEARVVLWLAGDEDALDTFRSGKDIYCEMAAEIYDRPVTKSDKDERALGKVVILACGFGMGAAKFQATCAAWGITIDEDFAKVVVDAYREKFELVKLLWYGMEAAAIGVVQSKRKVVYGPVEWSYRKPFLYCRLPSGRSLAYPFPEVHEKETPWGEMRPALTFMGVDAYSHKWKRQHTYGGSLVENIVQAIARDIMAEAMLRAEQAGYPVVLTVHDEIVSEAEQGDIAEFERLLTMAPKWGVGIPIAVEGWSGGRYKK